MSESKSIRFVKVGQKTKTGVYAVESTRNDANLGTITWYSRWRRYCFIPQWGSIWSTDCLAAVTGFIEELMRERKERLNRERNTAGG